MNSSSTIRNKIVIKLVFRAKEEEIVWEPTKWTVPVFSSLTLILDEPEYNIEKISKWSFT